MANYATMKPGPEMDTAVKQIVMGWLVPGPGEPDCAGAGILGVGSRWCPSTDPGACHEMLVHIRKTWSVEAIYALGGRLCQVAFRLARDARRDCTVQTVEKDLYPDSISSIFLDAVDYCRSALVVMKPGDGPDADPRDAGDLRG